VKEDVGDSTDGEGGQQSSTKAQVGDNDSQSTTGDSMWFTGGIALVSFITSVLLLYRRR